MGVKDPTTYGEWYWNLSTEASKLFDEEVEKTLSPAASSFFAALPGVEMIPDYIMGIINEMISPGSFAWGTVLARFGSEVADGVVGSALQTALKPFNYELNQRLQDTRLDPQAASTLYARKKIDEAAFQFSMSSAGYDEYVAVAAMQAGMPYPSIPELLTWARYHGDPSNTWSTLWDYFQLDPRDYPLWDWLGHQRLSTQNVQDLYKRKYIDGGTASYWLAQIGWDDTDQELIKELGYLFPNAMLQVQGGLMRGDREDALLEAISKADIHPEYAPIYLDAIRTKPSSQDLIAYHLRSDPDLSGLAEDLRRIGIHPFYEEVYKTLAYRIPPVADIITMAVREAFSPQVAARFGQYEDFPSDLERYAGMQGLNKEWAERYWAAHWSLPSSQQGFEMLHRGIITEDDLQLLLRALDVMPFWRDKLTQMAFKPLTRVDVRRMYKEGVLDEKEVFKAYLDIGYSEENAERMAEFTVRQTLSSLAKFTSSDIVKAYTQRMIDRNFAIGLLREIGVRAEDASYIVDTADYKRQWEFTNDRISALRNLYKKHVYDENETRDQLGRLDLPADQINTLMETWLFEDKEEGKPTWTTAQTLAFLKKGLISPDRASKELRLIGYDNEHINVYLQSIA